jgi:hypothetical protein
LRILGILYIFFSFFIISRRGLVVFFSNILVINRLCIYRDITKASWFKRGIGRANKNLLKNQLS